MRTSPFLFALVALACTGDSDTDTPTDSPEDSGSTDGTTALAECLALWTDGLTEPDADGPDTQIHGTSVFDGSHVWTAWNRRDSGTKFDIWLQRLACDGTVDIAPFQVTDTDDSELDPVLAVSGGRLLVAWTSDNGTGPNNLDIRTRVFDLDGTAITDPADLVATRSGAPVTGNAGFPGAIGIDGGFMLAGSWGHEASPAFQAFAVELDLDGAVQGDATDGQVDPIFGQTFVSLAEGDGGVRMVWQEDSVDSLAPSVVGGALGSAAPIAGPGARPKVAWGASGWWTAWDDDGGTIVVRTPSGAESRLGEQELVFSPSLAVTSTGAVVLGMEAVQGVESALVLWQLDPEGEVVYSERLRTASAISAYGVDLTRIDDTHAVVVYQDGVNPAFRLKAEWITLPE